MPTDVTVLVVGAGPTGLLLAAELHRRGVACRLIDAHPAPLHWDRATVVHPRSLEVFESLGLLEPFLAAGVKQRFARLHSAGRVLGRDRPLDLRQPLRLQPRHLGGGDRVDPDRLPPLGRAARSSASSRLVALKATDRDLLVTIERDGATEQVSCRLGRRVRRAAQHDARAERHRAGRPRHPRALGGVRCHPDRLVGAVRGDLRLSGRARRSS